MTPRQKASEWDRRRGCRYGSRWPPGRRGRPAPAAVGFVSYSLQTSPLAQLGHGCQRVAAGEDRRAHDADLPPGGDDMVDVIAIDAAVHGDLDRQPRTGDHFAQPPGLVEGA